MTPRAREALEWFRSNGPVGWFDWSAPSPQMRNRLERDGLIEPLPGKTMQIVKFQITPAGLEKLGGHSP